MIRAIRTILQIEELRKRILVTLGVLFVYRLGAFIPLPGINAQGLKDALGSSPLAGQALGWMSAFSGGAFQRMGIFALGIIPYISASIIFELLTHVIPALEKIAKEGQSGRQRISQYTRYFTVFVALVQASMLLGLLTRFSTGEHPLVTDLGFWSFKLPVVFTLIAGSLFSMWLGEQITEFGIGQGASILIMAGIVSDFPGAVMSVVDNFRLNPDPSQFGVPTILLLILMYVGVVVGVVFITQGQRRIPMQSARQVRGMRMTLGQRSFLPLKVNQSGVIPVIFASALLQFPLGILDAMGKHDLVAAFRQDRFLYLVPYVSLIFVFAFFYTAMVFNPNEWADNLKEYGSFIPGIRPGRHTAEYLEKIMNRVTLAGAAFLALISVIPSILGSNLLLGNLPHYGQRSIISFLGGTGILIVVGVALDMTQKVESHLLMREREGFMQKSRMRGRV